MSGPVPLAQLRVYLDSYLRTGEIPDDSNAWNGLQVENSGSITRVVAAVDASQTTINGLGPPLPGGNSGGPLLIVHHGLFWDPMRSVTGPRYLRIRGLLARDAALYSAHIPLDLHPEIGNNAVLASRLGLLDRESFGSHRGVLIGVAGRASAALQSRPALLAELTTILNVPSDAIRLIPGGPETIRRIGVITGGGGSAIGQAREAGCDTYITGEGAAHTYFDAMELGVNVFYGGHYATETFGARALAEHLANQFDLPWEFHDHPTGM